MHQLITIFFNKIQKNVSEAVYTMPMNCGISASGQLLTEKRRNMFELSWFNVATVRWPISANPSAQKHACCAQKSSFYAEMWRFSVERRTCSVEKKYRFRGIATLPRLNNCLLCLAQVPRLKTKPFYMKLVNCFIEMFLRRNTAVLRRNMCVLRRNTAILREIDAFCVEILKKTGLHPLNFSYYSSWGRRKLG